MCLVGVCVVGALIVGASTALPLAGASPAAAATLVGGRQQTAIERAFTAHGAHRHQVIVSVRVSSVSPAWAAVSSVTPQSAAGTQHRDGRPPSRRRPTTTASRGSERPAPPPKAVRADLGRDFQVEVVYTGSGGESITDTQTGQSVCAGEGNFTDTETDVVTPMSWTVRYVVDLDNLLAAVRNSTGTTIVPNVSFDYAGSTVDATEAVSRTLVDAGCNGKPTTFNCRMSFRAGGSDPGGQLSLARGGARGRRPGGDAFERRLHRR